MEKNYGKSRFEGLSSLSFSYLDVAIDRDKVRKTVREISRIVRFSDTLVTARQLDVGPYLHDEMRSLLGTFLPMNLSVDVFWPPDCVGMSIPYGLFVKHIDDLWYPGGDDIWIVKSGIKDYEYEWILECNHEEIVSLMKVSDAPTNGWT